MQTEISAGGIVFNCSQNETFKFLLLQHGEGGHWAVPKGHQENEENLIETAIREIHEETGIEKDQVRQISDFHEKIDYWFTLNGEKVHKFVHLFLFESDVIEVTLSEEHSDFGWFKFEDVKDQLTYDTSWPGFQKAHKIILDEKK